MTLATMTQFFQWCTIYGFGFYFLTVIMTIFFDDFVYRMNSKWYKLSRATYDTAIYAFVGGFKLMLIVFVLVPYLALLTMQ